jgi:hypothetical protein
MKMMLFLSADLEQVQNKEEKVLGTVELVLRVPRI